MEGGCRTSPLDPAMVQAIRAAAKEKLKAKGFEAELCEAPSYEHPLKKHMDVCFVAAALRAVGAPDWRVFAEVVARAKTWIGVEDPLPRTPAVFARKATWRAYGEHPLDPNLDADQPHEHQRPRRVAVETLSGAGAKGHGGKNAPT